MLGTLPMFAFIFSLCLPTCRYGWMKMGLRGEGIRGKVVRSEENLRRATEQGDYIACSKLNILIKLDN